MLGGIAQDRHDEDADEHVAETELVRGGFDGADQDLAHPRNRRRRAREHQRSAATTTDCVRFPLFGPCEPVKSAECVTSVNTRNST